MKIVLTGASGFVGGRILQTLEAAGHEVLRLSRREMPGPWQRYALGDDPAHIPWDGVGALVHAAYDFTGRSREETFARNVRPGITLLEAARQAGVPRLVFISSMSAYTGCRSDYGRAKCELEREVAARQGISLRPGLVWGETSGGVMGSLERLVDRLAIVPYPHGRGGLSQYLVNEEDLGWVVARSVLPTTQIPAGPCSVAHPAPVALRSILRQNARRAGKSRCFLAVPWPCVMAGLRSAELVGLRLPVRGDSLVGLVRGNPSPVLCDQVFGITLRPYSQGQA